MPPWRSSVARGAWRERGFRPKNRLTQPPPFPSVTTRRRNSSPIVFVVGSRGASRIQPRPPPRAAASLRGPHRRREGSTRFSASPLGRAGGSLAASGGRHGHAGGGRGGRGGRGGSPLPRRPSRPSGSPPTGRPSRPPCSLSALERCRWSAPERCARKASAWSWAPASATRPREEGHVPPYQPVFNKVM